MKIENYLTQEEIDETKGKSLRELQDLVARLTKTEADTPQDELMCSPSFAKANISTVYMYLSNMRLEVQRMKPDSDRIPALESMIDSLKYALKGLDIMEERANKYFDSKAALVASQQKILQLERKVDELEKMNENLINGLE